MTKELNFQVMREYYDAIYQRKGQEAMRPLAFYQNVFRYFLPVERGRKLLDVGCGTGYLLKTAQDHGLLAYGQDISPEAVEISRQTSPGAEVVAGPAESLPWPNSFFDYLICFGSLEHFLEMEKALAEMSRVTKDEAKFMIVVPNKNYWLWRWQGQWGTKQREMKEVLMTLSEWRGYFAQQGLKIESVHHDPWPWQTIKIFKFKNPWRILRRLVYKVVWWFIPLPYTYQFVFIMRKKT